MRRVMLVDDEPNVLNALERALASRLRGMGVRVECHSDPREALRRAASISVDVIVSDYRMPYLNGVELLKRLRELQPDAVRLILSASTDFQTVRSAVNQAEVFRYIAKPWDVDDVEQSLRLAFARRDAILEERRLADETRVTRGELSAAGRELRRLEEAEPGITRVRRDAEGGVLLE